VVVLLLFVFVKEVEKKFPHNYFLDENKIIFEKVTLKPWKFYKPSKKAKYILETKKNYINLKKGEKLELNKL
jgi:uncharacterized membrane protein (UPF0127 family)